MAHSESERGITPPTVRVGGVHQAPVATHWTWDVVVWIIGLMVGLACTARVATKPSQRAAATVSHLQTVYEVTAEALLKHRLDPRHVTDSEWRAMLIEERYTELPEGSRETEVMSDKWGWPFLWRPGRPPTASGSGDAKREWAILSVGENGLFEGGDGDDIVMDSKVLHASTQSVLLGVRHGTYWKVRDRAANWTLLVASVAGAVAIALVAARLRMMAALVIVGGLLLVLAAWATYRADDWLYKYPSVLAERAVFGAAAGVVAVIGRHVIQKFVRNVNAMAR